MRKEGLFGAVELGELDGAARERQRCADRLAGILAFWLGAPGHFSFKLFDSSCRRGTGSFQPWHHRAGHGADPGPLVRPLSTVVGMIRAFGVLGGDSVAGKRRQSIFGLYPLLGFHLAQDGRPEQRDGCLGEG